MEKIHQAFKASGQGTVPGSSMAVLLGAVCCFQPVHSLWCGVSGGFEVQVYCREVLEHENIITKRATNAVIWAASVSLRACVFVWG